MNGMIKVYADDHEYDFVFGYFVIRHSLRRSIDG